MIRISVPSFMTNFCDVNFWQYWWYRGISSRIGMVVISIYLVHVYYSQVLIRFRNKVEYDSYNFLDSLGPYTLYDSRFSLLSRSLFYGYECPTAKYTADFFVGCLPKCRNMWYCNVVECHIPEVWGY